VSYPITSTALGVADPSGPPVCSVARRADRRLSRDAFMAYRMNARPAHGPRDPTGRARTQSRSPDHFRGMAAADHRAGGRRTFAWSGCPGESGRRDRTRSFLDGLEACFPPAPRPPGVGIMARSRSSGNATKARDGRLQVRGGAARALADGAATRLGFVSGLPVSAARQEPWIALSRQGPQAAARRRAMTAARRERFGGPRPPSLRRSSSAPECVGALLVPMRVGTTSFVSVKLNARRRICAPRGRKRRSPRSRASRCSAPTPLIRFGRSLAGRAGRVL
jgi:hypothetical protein